MNFLKSRKTLNPDKINCSSFGAILMMFGFLVISTVPTFAITYTVDFENLNPNTTYHGNMIVQDGFSLTSPEIRSIRKTARNSNGTVSIYTNETPLTLTYGNTNNVPFNVLSIDFGDVYGIGTPVVGYSGITTDNTVVSGRHVLAGSFYWTYPLTLGAPFTNLVSFSLDYTQAPFLYQVDNITLSSAFTVTGDLAATPLPETLPMFAIGALSFFIIGRRKRKT